MPSKVDVLAVVDDEIFRGTGIAGALVCTIDNGMQKVVICIVFKAVRRAAALDPLPDA
jgi:hypothetical protein